MKKKFTALREPMINLWKQALDENWLEGIRLNLFGGSMRETIAYLKNIKR